MVCIYQRLSERQINRYIAYLKPKGVSIWLIKHQKLSDEFIINNKDWLCMQYVSLWQKFTYEFLVKNFHLLRRDFLLINEYHKPQAPGKNIKYNDVVILAHADKLYIIDTKNDRVKIF